MVVMNDTDTFWNRRFRAWLLVVTTSLSLIGLSLNASEPEMGVVERVKDGDTIVVRLASGPETVRLIGVSAPETRGESEKVEEFGTRAKIHLESVILGKQVRLRRDPTAGERGSLGRLLRYVYLQDDRCLNEELVKQG